MENFDQSNNHDIGSSYPSARITGTHPNIMPSIKRGDCTRVPLLKKHDVILISHTIIKINSPDVKTKLGIAHQPCVLLRAHL